MHESSTLPLLADHRLPVDAAWLFPEYDFETMTPEHHERVIIERILERGTWEQLRWLFATYGEANVAEWARRHRTDCCSQGYSVQTSALFVNTTLCQSQPSRFGEYKLLLLSTSG